MILQINHKSYSEKEFSTLLTDYPDEQSWQYEIGLFMKNWLDDKSYVEVKTSGSTGVPKVIRMSKQTMIASARMTNQFFGLHDGSTALLCLPASYIAGKMMLVRAMVGNYSLKAVQPSGNPFIDLNESFDFSAITPYQMMQSADNLQSANIKAIIVGGSPVTAKMEKLTANWKIALFETFGMTETASHIALRRFNGNAVSSFFQVLDGVQISRDDRNCLVIQAPHLTDEVLITNDIVEIKGQNEFQWLGRYDRVINTGGIKVFPEQIEKKLQDIIAFPFFISSIKDEKLGEKVILLIENNQPEDFNQAEILQKISVVLQKFEMPKEIIILPEFIRAANDKILRIETLKSLLF